MHLVGRERRVLRHFGRHYPPSRATYRSAEPFQCQGEEPYSP
ncbi:hypothetical protein FOWG_17763 [Fusarium oxysporum f. sp. lycopersici MN25]|nr:hypothetical protein FOWG_17763 [Fusarium oxysporum f. sp. lycopersici MN25]